MLLYKSNMHLDNDTAVNNNRQLSGNVYFVCDINEVR